MVNHGDEIPDMKISEAESVVRIIHSQFGGKVTTTDEEKLASKLGHTNPKSGAFRAKLTNLKKYGLIDGWGEKELTELGQDLVNNKERAVRKIVEENSLFAKAHDRFGRTRPDEGDWGEFLNREGYSDLDESEKNKTLKTYYSLIQQLPEETDEPFSKDIFEKYYSGLENDSKKTLCLQSLERLANRPIPSIENYNKIFAKLEETDDPNDEERLLNILKKMCYTSTEEVQDERLDDTVDLAMGFLDPAYAPKIRMKAIRILEAMHPPEADECDVEDLWDITQALAHKGLEDDNDDDLLKHARQIFNLLLDGWADETLLETMWEDTYDDYDETTPYGKFVGHWHEDCQDALGLS